MENPRFCTCRSLHMPLREEICIDEQKYMPFLDRNRAYFPKTKQSTETYTIDATLSSVFFPKTRSVTVPHFESFFQGFTDKG